MARPAQLGHAGLFVVLISLPYFSPQAERAGKAEASSMVELVRSAVANYKARQAQRNDYTYLERVVRTEFDRNGKPNGQITGTYEIMFLKGAPYRRLLRINDEPPRPELEKLEQQLLEAEARMREAGKGDYQPVRTSFFAPVDQLMEGFRLHWRGRQVLNGRDVQMIEAVPDDKHLPSSPKQDYARHFRMKVWIDTKEAQIVRVESRVAGESVAIDQDGIGFFQDRSSPDVQIHSQKFRVEVARGTASDMEWTKVNDEAWLPSRSYWNTRKMTVTNIPSEQKPLSIRVELTCSYSDYKKFRVNTRIAPE